MIFGKLNNTEMNYMLLNFLQPKVLMGRSTKLRILTVCHCEINEKMGQFRMALT